MQESRSWLGEREAEDALQVPAGLPRAVLQAEDSTMKQMLDWMRRQIQSNMRRRMVLTMKEQRQAERGKTPESEPKREEFWHADGS